MQPAQMVGRGDPSGEIRLRLPRRQIGPLEDLQVQPAHIRLSDVARRRRRAAVDQQHFDPLRGLGLDQIQRGADPLFAAIARHNHAEPGR